MAKTLAGCVIVIFSGPSDFSDLSILSGLSGLWDL